MGNREILAEIESLLEEKDKVLEDLTEEINEQNFIIQNKNGLSTNLRDQIKYDFLVEHWDNITIEDLEELVKNK